MVITVTLTEQDINAIGAALDERSERLHRELGRLIVQEPSPSRDFAIDCNRDAIRDGIRTRLLIAAAIEEPDFPEGMTFAAIGQDDPSVVWHMDLDR
jgi:hypothetical protein